MMDSVKETVTKNKSKIPTDSPLSQAKLDGLGMTGLTLRDYQLFGVNWLYNRYRGGLGAILCDEMGLGKTCQTISFLFAVTKLAKASSRPKHLVVCPLSVVDNWCGELERFTTPFTVIRYIGDKDAREEMRGKLREPFDVMVTTYELCLKDEKFLDTVAWTCLVVDEGHRLKNMKSHLHEMLASLKVDRRFILTGTPVQNNLNELYSLLHFVNPRLFRRKFLDEFVERFSSENDEISSELHDLLKPFLLRRMKDDVLKDLPTKSEVILFHPISSLQKKYYKAILLRDYDAFDGEGGTKKTRLMNILMQLRKCVVHPYLFPGVEPEPFELGEHLVRASGKLLLIDRLLLFLRRQGHKVLLFSQFTTMLDILQDYMDLRGFAYERLDGSVRGEERFLAVKQFNQESSNFVFLASTRAGGQGLNLVAADTVVFVDSDFNPQNDLQAAARAHRIGQTRPVRVVRLVGRHTVEEIVLRRAEAKLRLTSQVLEGGHFALGVGGAGEEERRKADEELRDILRFGVRQLLEEDDEEEEVDFEALLGRSCDGEWQPLATEGEEDGDGDGDGDADEVDTAAAGSQMYVFEGKDYSKELSAEDRKALERLAKLNQEEAAAGSGEYTLRRKGEPARPEVALPMAPAVARPRKPLTAEQLAERRRKREERLERQRREAEEKARERKEQQKARLRKKWEAAAYTSLSVELVADDAADDEDEDEDEDDERREAARRLHYVVGDVAHPQRTGASDAIICHCVDDSGLWGRGGVFDAISLRSPAPARAYRLAADMGDLQLGDVHLVPCDDLISRDKGGRDFVAFLVAHERDNAGRLRALALPRLEDCLRKVAQAARQRGASVHLPRLGHNTPAFNWYGVERCLKKHLAERDVPTFIYYYARRRGRGAAGNPGPRANDDSDANKDKNGKEEKEKTKDKKKADADTDDDMDEVDRGKPGTSSTWRRRRQLKDVSDSDSEDEPDAKRTRADSPPLRGVTVHLCGVDQPGRLVQEVIRLGGAAARRLSDGVTHVVVAAGTDPPRAPEAARVVPLAWLEASVRAGRRLREDAFAKE